MNSSIQELAQLMQERQKHRETPYVLLLGSSLSLTPSVRRYFAGTEEWETFWKKMERTAPTSRKALLKEPLDALGLEPGYQAIARLAETGYFDLVLTLNVDDALDDAVRPLPAYQSVLLIYDGSNAAQIVKALSRDTPRVKVVKLRGDINAQALPLTVTGTFEFPNDLARCVSEWLKRDTILVGDIPYDIDVQRCITQSDSALWCILPAEPVGDSFIIRVKRVRPFGEIITGMDAEFNAFFTALAEKVLEEKVKEGDQIEVYERSAISLAKCLPGDGQLLGDSDYREIEAEIAKEMREPDERLPSGEQPSLLVDSDYEKIEKDITEEMRKEVEASQEQTTVAMKELESIGDSDYREIEAEIVKEMREPDGRSLSCEQPIPPGYSHFERIAEEGSAPLISPDGLWGLLSHYPMAWFAIGVAIVVIITVLFFEPLFCVLEFRLTDATVALIALLALGVAGITFRIAPPQIDKVLQCLYGGVAVTLIIVVIAMRFLPPPSQESCFPTRVLTPTVAPAPTYTR